MVLRRLTRAAVAGAVILLGASGVGAQSGRPTLAALRAIEPGQWQLTEANGSATRRLCLSNPAALLQMRGGAACDQVIEKNEADIATVRYVCTGHGHGRTTVSVETPRLVKVESQGVSDGAPFQSVVEGRRVGDCR